MSAVAGTSFLSWNLSNINTHIKRHLCANRTILMETKMIINKRRVRTRKFTSRNNKPNRAIFQTFSWNVLLLQLSRIVSIKDSLKKHELPCKIRHCCVPYGIPNFCLQLLPMGRWLFRRVMHHNLRKSIQNVHTFRATDYYHQRGL